MLTGGLEESKTSKIEMTDVSDDVINQMVTYLYGNEIRPDEITSENGIGLFQLAHKYNIISLEKKMLQRLLQKPSDWFDINTVLDLYFFTQHLEQFEVLLKKMEGILKRYL